MPYAPHKASPRPTFATAHAKEITTGIALTSLLALVGGGSFTARVDVMLTPVDDRAV